MLFKLFITQRKSLKHILQRTLYKGELVSSGEERKSAGLIHVK